jgi:hypothetical protein
MNNAVLGGVIASQNEKSFEARKVKVQILVSEKSGAFFDHKYV